MYFKAFKCVVVVIIIKLVITLIIFIATDKNLH